MKKTSARRRLLTNRMKQFPNSRPMRSARTRDRQYFTVEQLETRTLLAADIATVFEFGNPDAEILGASSALTRTEESISVETNSSELVPGDAVTMWWVVFNNPEFCEGACNGPDLSIPEVGGGLFYADGQVVGEEGTASFTASFTEGDISNVDMDHTMFPAAETGLVDAAKAEIHIVLRTHGMALPEGDPLRDEQLSSFNAGCTPECSDVQAAVFISAEGAVSHSPLYVFGDATAEIAATEVKLTRYSDNVAARADASELVPGDAVTMWWVVFNNPEFCEGPCNGPDLRNPDVGGGLFYADGMVVREDGTASFTASLIEGDISNVDVDNLTFPAAETGLVDAAKAEVHVVLRTHSVAFPEGDPLRDEQISTFNAACNPECFNIQAAVFISSEGAISNSPLYVFSDTTTDIAATEVKMTRYSDSVAVRADTSELVPGDAVTMWWVVFNNPEFCEGPCNGPDLRIPEVGGGLFYADGQVVGEDGTASFTASLIEGDISNVDVANVTFPAAETGLVDAAKAEIRIVMRTHGVAFPEGDPLRDEQLSSYTAGCNLECTDVQVAIFGSSEGTVSNSPLSLFSDSTTDIAASDVKLTRYSDHVAARVDTSELVPGDAVTMWWVVFNNPEYCEGPCNGPDLRNAEVGGGLFYADGMVVREDGTATYIASLIEGDISNVDVDNVTFPAAETGLIDAAKAEVHVVLRTHSVAFPEGDPLRDEQISTFNAACNPECFNVQAAGFIAANGEVGDFDYDSAVTAKDIDLLFQTISSDNGNPLFDMNVDGSVNSEDVDELVQNVIGTHHGDSNLDGKVDFDDFLALASNFGSTGGWSEGDSNGDGMINFADLIVLSKNFGAT